MARQTPTPPTPQQLPKTWLVAIAVALIAYTLVQPLANSRWGWQLPGLASLLGTEEPAANVSPANGPVAPQSGGGEAEVAALPSGGTNREPALPRFPAPSSAAPPASQPKPDSASLLYGLLTDAGREVYISPAGLRYTRGSQEGHRLKHLERHLNDIPDRPGKHGVFDGDMAQALRWIDDAYLRGEQGAAGVRKREEEGRTVYEVPFPRPIGYIGGRDGKRDRNPDSKRLRLVVDGVQVITAFPF
jgi:hypothetical protein